MNLDLTGVDPLWQKVVNDLMATPEGAQLQLFLSQAVASGETVLPPPHQWFEALRMTPLDRVRVVILGQDPYHGVGQAHGLAFSVQPGVPVPPSLKNIFQALHNDLGCDIPQHGCLTSWAQQGVLLLNTLLTVAQGQPLAHQRQGWEVLTDQLIKTVNDTQDAVVFLLWGKDAQKKKVLIDQDKHVVLEAAHPSPLSAYRGFMHCGHFSQANEFLVAHHKPPINWPIS